jgi:membrane associated rhomboid family serine protease
MREGDPRPTTSVLTWLICGIVAGFLLQNVFLQWLEIGETLEDLFALKISGLESGRVWTLLTYSFLHHPRNLLHIVGVLLALYFLGRELLPLLGPRRFLGVYAVATMVGGLVWTAAHWTQGGMLMGASAAVFALLVIFACFYPNQQMTFLLFFVFPVTVKPKHLAIGAALLDVAGFIYYEILGRVSPFGFAHSAHLGGMAVGWFYFRYVHQANWGFLSRSDMELPRWVKKNAKVAAPAAPYRVNLTNRADLRAEVDRILDKINSQGFNALTPEEKRVLDDAKDVLSSN